MEAFYIFMFVVALLILERIFNGGNNNRKN